MTSSARYWSNDANTFYFLINGNWATSLPLPLPKWCNAAATFCSGGTDSCCTGYWPTAEAACSAACHSCGSPKWSSGNSLTKGNTLSNNQYIISENCFYQAKMQSNGNFVVYNLKNGHNAIWDAKTMTNTVTRIIMQQDGNLVIYKPDNTVLWASNTKGSGDYLVIENTGILAVYDTSGSIKWGM
jgi:hypothetical protein